MVGDVTAPAYDFKMYPCLAQVILRREQVAHVAPPSDSQSVRVLKEEESIPDFPVLPHFQELKLEIEGFLIRDSSELIDLEIGHGFIIAGNGGRG
jgi:hypothetical protein